jgi:phage terminase small subunit
MPKFTFTEKQLELSRELTDLQRKTVINMIKGNLSQRKAYYKAGGKAKTDEAADVAACNMLKKVKVNAFYNSLLEESAGDSILSRTEAMEILTDIAKTKINDIADFSTITIEDVEGKTVKQSVWSFKDSDTISESAARVVNEVSVGKDGIKFKTHSQVDAIKQLRAMEGWDKAVKHEHSGPDGGPIETKSDEDLARKIAFMLTKGVTGRA